jgi:hypothetical protein
METFSKEDIVVYNDFFDVGDYKVILDYLNRSRWRWGHGSLPDDHPNKSEFNTPFWIMDLERDYFFTDYLLNIIMESTDQKYAITGCYCNGHTYGTSGNFHVDWYDPSGRTVLLYANDIWKQEWGGKTAFNLGDTYHYTEFVPNSVVIFPGMIPHRSEGTSRLFTGLRKTVAWKLVLK